MAGHFDAQNEAKSITKLAEQALSEKSGDISAEQKLWDEIRSLTRDQRAQVNAILDKQFPGAPFELPAITISDEQGFQELYIDEAGRPSNYHLVAIDLTDGTGAKTSDYANDVSTQLFRLKRPSPLHPKRLI